LFAKLTPEVRAEFAEWAPAITKADSLTDVHGVGPRAAAAPEESAQAEIMKLAEGIVEKDASGKLDMADAILQIRQQRPDLVERSRREALGVGG